MQSRDISDFACYFLANFPFPCSSVGSHLKVPQHFWIRNDNPASVFIGAKTFNTLHGRRHALAAFSYLHFTFEHIYEQKII